MSLSTDIRRLLLSKSAITSLVGTRVYPHHVPQANATYPSITYAIVSNDSAHTLAGGAGYAARRLQIDVYAKTETSRDAVVEAIRNQLQGFPPAGTSGTIGAGTVVTSITYKNGRDLYEPDQTSGDVGYYRHSMDFWIRFQESAPSFAS
jgi:acid phosphatase class B